MIGRSSIGSFDSLLLPKGNTLLGMHDDSMEYLDDNSSVLFPQIMELPVLDGHSIQTVLPEASKQPKQRSHTIYLLSAVEKKAKKKLNDEKYRLKKKAKLKGLEEESKELEQLTEETQKLRRYCADKDDISRRLEEQIKIVEKLTAESDQLKEDIKLLQNSAGHHLAEDLQRPICHVSNPRGQIGDQEFKGFQGTGSTHQALSPLAGHGWHTLLCYFDSQVNEFIKKLDEDVKSSVKYSDFVGLEGEHERVGEYSFPASLVPTLESITNTFGDITAGCLLNHDLVENAYILFCATVHEMNQMSLNQVTESTMFKWRDIIKDAMRINCNVCFAMEHLKKVARAYFGLKAFEDLRSVNNQILKLERLQFALWEQRRNIEQQLKTLKREKANKEDLVRLKSGQSEACIASALDFRGKTVGSGLFIS